jgi:hypothetical protein
MDPEQKIRIVAIVKSKHFILPVFAIMVICSFLILFYPVLLYLNLILFLLICFAICMFFYFLEIKYGKIVDINKNDSLNVIDQFFESSFDLW